MCFVEPTRVHTAVAAAAATYHRLRFGNPNNDHVGLNSAPYKQPVHVQLSLFNNRQHGVAPMKNGHILAILEQLTLCRCVLCHSKVCGVSLLSFLLLGCTWAELLLLGCLLSACIECIDAANVTAPWQKLHGYGLLKCMCLVTPRYITHGRLTLTL
jgi:hypothetical protein